MTRQNRTRYIVNDPVITVCYGKEEFWESREEARCFFLEAMLGTDGSERERYAKVLADILQGFYRCTDTWE